MEKFIKTLSAIITSVLFYIFASYIYLSHKGFVYENGGFTLIKEASAATDNQPLQFANKINPDIALNFKDDKAGYFGSYNIDKELFFLIELNTLEEEHYTLNNPVKVNLYSKEYNKEFYNPEYDMKPWRD